MTRDPATTDPDHYTVVFENDRVRVLEYKDKPGEGTSWHAHPDSLMYTLSAFRRRILADGRHVDVELQAGQARWVSAQEHSGQNTGDTDSYALFVELRNPQPPAPARRGHRWDPASPERWLSRALGDG